MVMRPEPWGEALDAVCPPGEPGRLVVPTPSGRPFTQALAAELALEPHLIFACGRYEGIDYRVIEDARDRMPVDEVSLGDYVLAGGEVAVLVITEAISRLVPGVVGNVRSVEQDSFADGLLEGPAYTRPEVWRGRPVPDVLISGHHGKIARWRRDESLRRTADRRPDLLAALPPDALDKRDHEVLGDQPGPPP
jgi:tRNA (guanine37-N1)-methyltransferase